MIDKMRFFKVVNILQMAEEGYFKGESESDFSLGGVEYYPVYNHDEILGTTIEEVSEQEYLENQ